MSNKLSWRDALKQFNDNRVKEGGKYTIPKKARQNMPVLGN